MTEPSAACGRFSEAEEVKTASRQEGIYAVAVCDECFFGEPAGFDSPAFYRYKTKNRQPKLSVLLERVMGIEPTRPAWKAGVLPLNYTRILSCALFSLNIISLVFGFVKHLFYHFLSFIFITLHISTKKQQQISLLLPFYLISVFY